MTASRLRKIGNLGIRVDPAAVIAVRRSHKPAGVDIVIDGGVRMIVVDAALLGRDVIDEDLDKVHAQLTEGREARPPRARTLGGQ